MQYYFRYILGLKERPSLRLSNGKAGHNALEHSLRTKMRTKAEVPTEELMDVFSDFYTAETAEIDPNDLKPGEDLGKQKDETANTLRYYQARRAPLITPLAVEQEFTLTLDPTETHPDPELPIIGRIDTIQTETEKHPLAVPKSAVIDHKFVGRMYNQMKVDIDDQPTLYDAVMRRAGIHVARLGFQLFLPPDKTGPRIVPMYRSAELVTPEARENRIARLIFKIRTALRQIRAGDWMPTDNPITCASCGFRERCQMSLVKSDYEAMMIRQKYGERGEP